MCWWSSEAQWPQVASGWATVSTSVRLDRKEERGGRKGGNNTNRSEHQSKRAYKAPYKYWLSSQLYIPTALHFDLVGAFITYSFVIVFCMVTCFIFVSQAHSPGISLTLAKYSIRDKALNIGMNTYLGINQNFW